MNKVFRKIHIYLSLPIGIILSILCFSGAGMLIDGLLDKARNSDYYVVRETDTLTTGRLSFEALHEEFAAQGKDLMVYQTITVPSDENGTYQLNSPATREVLYVNPFNGQEIGTKAAFSPNSFYGTMFRLHRWLLDNYKRGEFSIGKLVTGISTLCFVVILLTGIFIFLPRLKRGIKQAITIHTDKGTHRFIYDSHVSLGMYLSLFLLVLALTGLLWSFNWYRQFAMKTFGIQATAQAPHSKPVSKADTVHYAAWDIAMSHAKAQYPKAEGYKITNGEIKVFPKHSNMKSIYDTMKFDTTTGETTEVVVFSQLPSTQKFMSYAYLIHTGGWYEPISVWLTLIIALLGGTLPLTGYYLWIKKQLNKK